MSSDIDQWPTDEEAAATLGTSSKTIHRYAEKGWIEMRKRPIRGRKPANVCNPRDVEKLKPPPHVMAADRLGDVENLRLSSTEGKLTFAYLLQEFLRRTTPAPAIETAPRPWITLDEAAEEFRFSPRYIRKQIKRGMIDAVRGGPRGALRIRRASLEAFQG